MCTSRTILAGVAFAAMLGTAFPAFSTAIEQCDSHAFAVSIDQTAQALRTLNRDSETRFQERLQALAKSKGWTEAQKIETASAAMDDRKLENFNSEIEELVAQLDALSATPKGEISCTRLNELKVVREKLLAVMGQKSGFILAQLEAEAAKASARPSEAPAAEKAEPPSLPKQASSEPVQAKQPASAAWSVNVTQSPPQPQRPGVPPAAQTRPPATQTRNQVASLTPPPDPVIPANPATGYTIQEIRDAGQGVFGTLTSEFAVVVNHAFKTYGQPNAYIVGDEGGGAFLAGLRYGDGKLYTRINGVESGPTPIYWQGPSLGADVGATGSHALFLVYNLNDIQKLYRRFPGIDGAAYVSGGFGLTVYKSGDLLIVPIRTGLGFRLGASFAYLKFTERASLNPF